ncbi:Clp protease [Gracilaria domingensis]|nr:Clp protease [Gracilaria domingensis]
MEPLMFAPADQVRRLSQVVTPHRPRLLLIPNFPTAVVRRVSSRGRPFSTHQKLRMVGCHATFVGFHAIRLPCRRLRRTRACEARPALRSPVRMAGGVPKVSYKAPGAQNHEFIDIFNRLYRERIIYGGQDLDDESANQIIAVLLYLKNYDAKVNVSMYFNCPGGTIPAGVAVYDCMQAMKYPVVTLNLGLAASMSANMVGIADIDIEIDGVAVIETTADGE